MTNTFVRKVFNSLRINWMAIRYLSNIVRRVTLPIYLLINLFVTMALVLPKDLLKDPGREEITLNPEDRGKFKVPSLRNVEFSAPYMHNGKLSHWKMS